MKKLFLFVIVFEWCICGAAQNAGELYQQYETAIHQGDYQRAYNVLEQCDNLCNHSPLSAFSLTLMYLMGKGTPIDTTQAIVCAGMTSTFDYRRSHPMNWKQFGERLGMSASAIQQMKDDFDEQNRQYDLYMKLTSKEENAMKAFACRWLGCLSFMGISPLESFEDNLATASSALADLQKADSLTSDVYATYLIGRIYYEGLIGFKDKNKGLHFIELAALKGSLSALTYLGEIKYEQGDRKEARKLWKEATEMEVFPLLLPTRQNILYYCSPNVDIGDVREMKQRAHQNLRK